MPSNLIRRARTRQPQEAFERGSGTYASRLVQAITPFGSILGAATPVGGTSVGRYGVGAAGGSGAYLLSAAAAAGIPGRSTGNPASSRDFTLIFVVSDLGVGVESWLYDGQSDGGGTGYAVKRDSSGNLYAALGVSSNAFGTVAWPDDARVILISSGRHNNAVLPRVWFDGVGTDGNSSYQDSWSTTPSFRTFFGSSAYPTANTFSGRGYLAGVMRGLLSDADAKRLTDNIWSELFAPRTLPVYAPTGRKPGSVIVPVTQEKRVARTRQPQRDAVLATSLRDARAGFSATRFARSIVDGRPLPVFGSSAPTSVVTKDGVAADTNSSGYNPTGATPSNSPYTILFYGVHPNLAAGAGTNPITRSREGGNNDHALSCTWYGSVDYSIWAPGTVGVSSGSGAIVSGRPFFAAVKADGANLTLVVDRTINRTATTSYGQAYSSAAAWELLGGASSGLQAYYSLWVPRAMSDAELLQLGANPWQLFAPESRPTWYDKVKPYVARAARRTRQPQQPSQLNDELVRSYGLQDVFVAGRSIRGGKTIAGASGVHALGRGPIHTNTTTAVSAGVSFDPSAWSVILAARFDSLGAYAYSLFSDSSVTRGISLNDSDTSPGRLLVYPGAKYFAPSLGVANGETAVIAVGWDGTKFWFAKNGFVESVSGASMGSGNGWHFKALSGNLSTYVPSHVAFFSRCLPKELLARLTENPNELFAPESRRTWLEEQPLEVIEEIGSTIAPAAGVSTTSALAGSAVVASTITPAAGVSTTSTLTSGGTTSAAITPAAGVSTTSALAGNSVAAATTAAASGVSTTSGLVGSATVAAAISAAAGVSTAGSLVGSAATGSAITQAAGSSTTSTLTGSSAASAAITAAAGVSTTSTLTSGSATSAAITQADGTSTASTLTGSATAATAIAAAAGVSTASTVTAGATAAAAITQAAGVSTTSTLTGTGLTAGASAITPAAGVSTTSTLAGSATAAAAVTPAAGTSTAATITATGIVSATMSPASGTSTAGTLTGTALSVASATMSQASGTSTAATFAASAVAASVAIAAAGASSAQTMTASAMAVAAINAAAGVSTTRTLYLYDPDASPTHRLGIAAETRSFVVAAESRTFSIPVAEIRSTA